MPLPASSEPLHPLPTRPPEPSPHPASGDASSREDPPDAGQRRFAAAPAAPEIKRTGKYGEGRVKVCQPTERAAGQIKQSRARAAHPGTGAQGAKAEGGKTSPATSKLPALAKPSSSVEEMGVPRPGGSQPCCLGSTAPVILCHTHRAIFLSRSVLLGAGTSDKLCLINQHPPPCLEWERASPGTTTPLPDLHFLGGEKLTP